MTTPNLIVFNAVKNDLIHHSTEYNSIHAEVDAVMKLPKGTNFRKVTLYVAREGMKLSRPCNKCERVLSALGIRKIFYSHDGLIEKM